MATSKSKSSAGKSTRAKSTTSAKKRTTPRKPAVKKPAVEVRIVEDAGRFGYVTLDEDGKELTRADLGSRNRAYARKVAVADYPDLPIA